MVLIADAEIKLNFVAFHRQCTMRMHACFHIHIWELPKQWTEAIKWSASVKKARFRTTHELIVHLPININIIHSMRVFISAAALSSILVLMMWKRRIHSISAVVIWSHAWQIKSNFELWIRHYLLLLLLMPSCRKVFHLLECRREDEYVSDLNDHVSCASISNSRSINNNYNDHYTFGIQ